MNNTGLLSKVTDFMESAAKSFLTVAFGIMTLVTSVEVIRRYIFGLSFPWAEELVRFLLVWVTFIGGSVAFKRGELVYLDLFVDKLSPTFKKVAKGIVTAVTLVFLLITLWLSIDYVRSPSITMQISPGMNVPMAYPYAAIPVGLSLMIVFCISNLLSASKPGKEG
ncbi:MAG TPA: TRAP transporter small permease [Firmicutes bacterium]|nr:TRAP transporter small permease [Bacillota bacterium]